MKATIPDAKDITAQTLLLLIDRYLGSRKIIESAWASGQPVISDRSYLSTMVYQSGEGFLSPANIAYLHSFLPQPTEIFLLDISAEQALDRIESRMNAIQTPRGEHETLTQLESHRQGFLSLPHFFPGLHILATDAEDPLRIHEQIWSIIKGREG